MSLPLTGSQGLFPRIGALGQLLTDINSSRGTTIPSDVTSINNQFTSTDQNIINNLYSSLSSYQNSCSSFNSQIKQIASSTVIQMVNDVSPQANQNLSTALQYVINQMKASSQTVNRSTIGSSVSYSPSNIGNPSVVISLNDVNNLPVEDCFAELATATVTVDSQSSPNIAGTETIILQSQYSISDTFSWLYPEGSGTSLSLSAVSGMLNGGSGTTNWLNNGSFETWSPTANGTPTSWNIQAGSAGGTILQSSSPVYDGSYALQFLGNGSENTSLYQSISTPSSVQNTNTKILPNTIFAFNGWIQVSGTPSSGTVRIALSHPTTPPSPGGLSPINDNSGTPNAVYINLNTLTNTWTPFNGVFRTPNQLPSMVNFEIKLSTPLTSGFSVYFDRVSFCQMSKWYNGGPFISVFSGNINMIKGDSFLTTITNSYNGHFQWFFDKCFNMKSLGLILPSSTSPTIPDSF